MKIFASLISRSAAPTLCRVLYRTFDLNRQIRFLSSLMVGLTAGVSGLTGIVGIFLVKAFLDLPAGFLAMPGFAVGLPLVLKIPLGHIVDLLWKWGPTLAFPGVTTHRCQPYHHAHPYPPSPSPIHNEHGDLVCAGSDVRANWQCNAGIDTKVIVK